MTDLTQIILTGDEYYDAMYKHTHDDIQRVLENVTVTEDGRSLATLLGTDATEGLSNIINNEVITPLINALANFHKTTQVLDTTTHAVLKRDMVLHQIPDVYLFSQQIAALRQNCNIYFHPDSLHGLYPSEEGWTSNLLMVEEHAIEIDRVAGITYEDGEPPLRNVNVSVVLADGTLCPNVRYTNFTYEDSTTGSRVLTDIPAFWDEGANEYLIDAAIALIRLRDTTAITDGINVTGKDINTAYSNNIVAENDPITRAIFEANNAQHTEVKK